MFTTSHRTLPVINPNTLEKSGEISLIGARDIETIHLLMLQGVKLLKTTSPQTRSHWLTSIAQEIQLHATDLAQLIATEGGKPLKDARVEVQRAAITFKLCAEQALITHKEPADLSSSSQAKTKQIKALRFPIGPVLVLSAFNHPLNLLAHQVGTALAAGNPVCFKPSPATPYCAQWLADTLKKIGVDSSIALLVHADVPEIEALVAHPVFKFVSFVGSAQIGWSLRAKLAPGTRLALEHGGVATAIVCADADLDHAARSLCKGAFYHAGQVCISTQKIFVHQRVFAAFRDKLIELAGTLVVGDAREEQTDVGPLIRKENKTKVLSWIEEAKHLGAQVALAQKDSRHQYMSPTILTHVPAQALLMNEEAFAPVVCVNPYTEINDCYQAIEDSPYHFAASIFTRDSALIDEAEKNMSCMNLMINDHTAWRVDAMAFGGHQQSGLGMGGVKWAVSEQTRLKQIIKNEND
jgi:acyl-CoA reductase-like NAD-dependent aldehyde dehydrogenase